MSYLRNINRTFIQFIPVQFQILNWSHKGCLTEVHLQTEKELIKTSFTYKFNQQGLTVVADLWPSNNIQNHKGTLCQNHEDTRKEIEQERRTDKLSVDIISLSSAVDLIQKCFGTQAALKEYLPAIKMHQHYCFQGLIHFSGVIYFY